MTTGSPFLTAVSSLVSSLKDVLRRLDFFSEDSAILWRPELLGPLGAWKARAQGQEEVAIAKQLANNKFVCVSLLDCVRYFIYT